MGESFAEAVEVSRASIAERAYLLQLHSHDMSEFNGDEVDEEGLFGYEEFDLFWTENARHPYLVRSAGKVVGFALMIEEEKDDHTPFMFMADFFIVKKYRRLGIGQAAAFQLFDLFPGEWQVSEMAQNLSAQLFWRKIIGHYTGGEFEEVVGDGWDGVLQMFHSPGRR